MSIDIPGRNVNPRKEAQTPDRDLLFLILDEIRELRHEVHHLVKKVRHMNQNEQQAFDDLNSKVTDIENAEQAAETLLTSLSEQLQGALNSSNDPTEVVNAVQAISERLNTDAAALAQAVTANTPAASSGNAGSTSSSGGSSDTGGSSSSTGTDTGGSSSSDSSSGGTASPTPANTDGGTTAPPATDPTA